MSVPDILALFASGGVLPPDAEATEEDIFLAIRREAEKAMLAAGSPPDHPLRDDVGRLVASYIYRMGQRQESAHG